VGSGLTRHSAFGHPYQRWNDAERALLMVDKVEKIA